MQSLRTAIHPSVWGPRWDADGIRPTLDAARRIGYHHVVVPLRDFTAIDPPALARAFADFGLSPLNTAGIPLDRDIGSPDAAVRAAGMAHLGKAIAMARDMGSSQINGVLYAPLARAAAPASADTITRSADCMAKLAATAAANGIRLALEVVNRYETNVLNTVSQALDYIRMVGHANVGLHLDTFHMSIEEADPSSALKCAMPHLFYFELDQSHRGMLGAGSLDVRALLRTAVAAGYRGIVGVEAFSRSRMAPDHASGLAIWRDTFTDSDALAFEAHAMITQALADAR